MRGERKQEGHQQSAGKDSTPSEPLVHDVANAKDSEGGPDQDRQQKRTKSGFKNTGNHKLTADLEFAVVLALVLLAHFGNTFCESLEFGAIKHF